MNQKLKVALVAAEPSGDKLGAQLIAQLVQIFPNIECYGIAGPEMAQAGCQVWYSTERLSVMGLGEVLFRALPILRLRRKFLKRLLKDPPDLYIGIDAYDFNCSIEAKLKRARIPVAHYVSPKVWAGRRNRVLTLGFATDLILCLFPFEVSEYHRFGIPAQFVGHPLADMIPLESDQLVARQKLQLAPEGEVVAILPGSRAMEIKQLSAVFIQTASQILLTKPQCQFIVPMVNQRLKKQFLTIVKRLAPSLPLTVFDGRSDEVIVASDAVLCAAGTATLQAMLLKRPMVVAYIMSRLTNVYYKLAYRYPYVALPNIILGKKVVPEFVGEEATVQNLTTSLLQQLESGPKRERLLETFLQTHCELRQDASCKAAKAIQRLLIKKRKGNHVTESTTVYQ